MAISRGLDGLSTELVVDILSRLHYLELVQCRRLCKRLQTIIDDTPRLQYIIEFGAAGEFPARRKGLNVAEALEELRRVHKALRDPHPRLHRRVPLQFARTYGGRRFRGFSSKAVAYGDSLVGSLDRDETRASCLGILSLRSEDMPMEERFRVLEFEVEFKLFFVDASQDLVILLKNDVLHFRSFATGEVHPRVTQRMDGSFATSIGGISEGDAHTDVQVDGNWLLVQKSGAQDGEIYKNLWHWPTGEPVKEWPIPARTRDIVSYPGCLCRGYLFAPVKVQTPSGGQLDIIALPNNYGGPMTRVASYEIPSGSRALAVCTSEGFNTRQNSQSQIAVLRILFWDEWLYVKVDALTRNAARYAASGALVDGCVPWDLWGPNNTWSLALNARLRICGYTMLFSDQIRSFNALDIAHDLYTPQTKWVPTKLDIFKSSRFNPKPKMFLGREEADCGPEYRKSYIWLPVGGTIFAQGNGTASDFLFCIDDGGPKVVRVVMRVLSKEGDRPEPRLCPMHLEIFTFTASRKNLRW